MILDQQGHPGMYGVISPRYVWGDLTQVCMGWSHPGMYGVISPRYVWGDLTQVCMGWSHPGMYGVISPRYVWGDLTQVCMGWSHPGMYGVISPGYVWGDLTFQDKMGIKHSGNCETGNHCNYGYKLRYCCKPAVDAVCDLKTNCWYMVLWLRL